MRDRYFCLRGAVVDDTGKPLPGARLQALLAGTRAAWTTSRSDGTYALWADRAIDMLTVSDGFPRMERPGHWRANAEVNLDERHHGFVIVTGQLLDADGNPADGFEVFAALRPGQPANLHEPKDRTGARGDFCVRVPRHVRHLWFRSQPDPTQPPRTCDAEINPGELVVVHLPR